MPPPQKKLTQSLEALHELQRRGVVAIRSNDLSRTDRQRLLKSGFLKGVMKGWYIPSRPDQAPGDSTAWVASFWDFIAAYLSDRFGEQWCLEPEHSLSLHGCNRGVPAQLLVRAPKGGNKPTPLPHATSLFDMRAAMPPRREIVQRDGLRLFSVPAALIAVSEQFFRRASTDVRAAMATIEDASDVLALLLEGGHSTIAGRLAGAFGNAGQHRIADDIVKTMEKAGYTVRTTDPFKDGPRIMLQTREPSPHVNRIRLMWQTMRDPVLSVFPAGPGLPRDARTYLKAVYDIYVNDAYHSLSIEGYRVSRELVGESAQRQVEPRSESAGSGQPQRARSARLLRRLCQRDGKRGDSAHQRERGSGQSEGSRGLVQAALRAQRDRRNCECAGTGRLPGRPGLHQGLDACAAAARSRARMHARAVRVARERG